MKYQGQMAGYGPPGTEIPSVQKRSFQPSTGRSDGLFLAESSGNGETNFRIGNSISDVFSSLYRGNLGDNLQNLSGGMMSQHKVQVSNTQQGIHPFTDKDVQFAKPNIIWSEHQSHQFCNVNSFSTGFQTKSVNSLKSGFNYSESMFHCIEPSPQSSTSVGEFSQLSSSQYLTYGLSSQAEAGKFLSHGGEGAGSRENVQADFNSKVVMNMAIRKFLPPNMSSFGPINASYGSVPSESIGILNLSSQTTPTTEGNQADESYHSPSSEVHMSCYPWGNVGASFHAKVQEKNEFGMLEKPSDCKGPLLDCARLRRSPSQAHSSKKADASDSRNENSSLKVEASQEIGNTVNKSTAPCDSQPSFCMDSTCKLPSLTSTITEKLWEGKLQLNTSTVVSAVAVFKSGEKVSELNWSTHVEVKGKVRLEAFEKFVQELPRSRTRALMVISIYWKVGSSETGLMGMKEIAKGYKEGQRVGFAQLCPGIDLYVCPHSEAIITILAKYGFFKGMTAVEDDQDSLVGCVVWRRNHPSSDFALKKTEKKGFPSLEQPLDSPSEYAISNNADKNSSMMKTMDTECNQVMPGFKVSPGATSPLKPLAPENENTDETKSIKSSKVSKNVISDNSNVTSVLTPLTTCVSSVIPQLPLSVQKMDIPPEDLSKCVSHATHFTHNAAQKAQVEFESSLQALSRALQKSDDNHRSSVDNGDDDLPEFDFRNAYGVPDMPDSKLPSSSHNHRSLELPPHNQQLHADVNSSASVPVPSEFSSVRMLLPKDASHRPHAPSSFDLMQNVNQKVLLPKEVGVSGNGGQPAVQSIDLSSALGGSKTDKNSAGPAAKSFFAQKMVETIGPAGRSGASEMQISASQLAKSSFRARRPIWDDDDDMPEWSPPNLDNGQQPPMSVLPLLLSPQPPPTLRPMFPAPPSVSALSWSMLPPPLPLQMRYDQNISYQHQSGILGQRPTDSSPLTPMQTRPATRFGQLDWRASPEPEPTQVKRRRRVSGWDVKPWEVKPDPWDGQSGKL